MFINPLLMLIVYTFVFSFILKARWGVSPNENRVDFAIILFAGLIVFSVFSETLNQAPFLITNNVNYVKKVVFPLEILSCVSLGSTLFHFLISIGVLLIVQLLLKSYFPLTVFLFPVVILPIIFFNIGLSWLLSSLGVFIRDISQFLAFLNTILLFTSAVFFPLSNLPQPYQTFLRLNPLALIIEESRKVLVYSQFPNWSVVGTLWIISILFAYFGYWWFQKTRKGFADVL
jgi:lipopolysaccharide transport system permease protein